MIDLDVHAWVNLPRPILEHLKSRAFPMKQRVWACILIHSLGHEYQSPYCLVRDRSGLRPMRQTDIARELELDPSKVSHSISQLQSENLLRTEGWKLYPVPKPAPLPDQGGEENRNQSCPYGQLPNEESTTYKPSKAVVAKVKKVYLAALARYGRAVCREIDAAFGLEPARRRQPKPDAPVEFPAPTTPPEISPRQAHLAGALRPLFPNSHLAEAFISRLDDELAGADVDAFVQRVQERIRRSAIGPGLLPTLAKETAQIWKAQESLIAADRERVRQEELAWYRFEIRGATQILADPTTPADDRQFWRDWLDRTRRDFPELFSKGAHND